MHSIHTDQYGDNNLPMTSLTYVVAYTCTTQYTHMHSVK